MKEFTFSYTTIYYFEQPVTGHFFTIKCQPDTEAGQTIRTEQTELSQTDFCSEGRDAFGNRMLYGRMRAPHDRFSYQVTGRAMIESSERDTDDRYLDLYLQQTARTAPGKEMLRRIDDIRAQIIQTAGNVSPDAWGNSIYERINHAVHELLVYTPEATTVDTTAEEALAIGAGVCQDYAHILLGILRKLHVPCRYVVGMMQGEGSSHAWVELWRPGTAAGWYGYDPTNDKPTDDGYIRISHGRDYADCLVMRGIYHGTAAQKQEVHVCVEEADAYESSANDSRCNPSIHSHS